MGTNFANTQNLDDASLALEFTPTNSINYGIVVQEPEFFADFGAFSYVTDNSTIRYDIKKIVFKIGKGEHFIADQQSAVVGELHIHGSSSSGNNGVLAVQMSIGTKINPFIDNLNVKKWDYTKSKTGPSGQDNKVCL